MAELKTRPSSCGMKKDQDAARLEAVCARHGIPVPQNDANWKPLAMALMAAHESEFKPPRKRKSLSA